MALTPSAMIDLGTPAPDFVLPDVATGKPRAWGELRGSKATLVMFICRHCPYVRHVEGELGRLERDYAGKGVALVAISANDADAYPADAPPSLAEYARAQGWGFAFLHDADQSAARAYGATCTPDFFLYGANGKLAYRGQLDDSRPGNGVAVTGRDLRAALDRTLAGGQPSAVQKPSVGCNIKWKSGRAPERTKG